MSVSLESLNCPSLILADSTTLESATPLNIINSADYKNWLEKQNSQCQNWLSTTQYNGKGLSLIPDTDGQLMMAIFVTDNSEQLFSCAELSKQLPAVTFVLNSLQMQSGNEERHSKIELNAAISWGLSQYRFKPTDEQKPTATLAVKSTVTLKSAHEFIQATYLVRHMVNKPAGDMMPEHMAKTVEDVASKFGAQFSQIIGDDLLTENYPTIHAVGRASVHQPRLLDMRWGDEKHPKVTLVGKGVCFDSGGLDLKPSNAMRLMKKDMGGAAHVMGLAYLIMSQNLPINLRVMIPSVENAVSNNAFRPGDVINTRHGLSVEVDNTDAEGRLVLCDALSEANNDNPELIIDYATLTGACRVALGTELPGFFSTDNQVSSELMQAGETSQDPVWQLPLHQPYRDMLKSDVADLSNCAPSGFGGAITAALYLKEFVTDGTPWLHFDVMAWNNRSLPGRPVGGEAMGMRAVFELLKSKYS